MLEDDYSNPENKYLSMVEKTKEDVVKVEELKEVSNEDSNRKAKTGKDNDSGKEKFQDEDIMKADNDSDKSVDGELQTIKEVSMILQAVEPKKEERKAIVNVDMIEEGGSSIESEQGIDKEVAETPQQASEDNEKYSVDDMEEDAE